MVSVATKIGMFTMFSTMALGRELLSKSGPPSAKDVSSDLGWFLSDMD